MILNEYENLVAADVVDPEDLRVGFDDVGGLDRTVQMLRVRVCMCAPVCAYFVFKGWGKGEREEAAVRAHAPVVRAGPSRCAQGSSQRGCTRCALSEGLHQITTSTCV